MKNLNHSQNTKLTDITIGSLTAILILAISTVQYMFVCAGLVSEYLRIQEFAGIDSASTYEFPWTSIAIYTIAVVAAYFIAAVLLVVNTIKK